MRCPVFVCALLAVACAVVTAAGAIHNAPADEQAQRQLARIPEGYRLVFHDDFESGRVEKRWRTRRTSVWRVEQDEGDRAYFLAKPGVEGAVRAPFSYALVRDRKVRSFVLTFSARCLTSPDVGGRDVLAVFAHHDDTHYYYVHFSKVPDPIHNAILVVNGRPREPLPLIGDVIGRLVDTAYHRFKVERNTATGSIRAYVDDMDDPVLQARDRTFAGGLVGVGSFDDTAYFDDVRLYAP